MKYIITHKDFDLPDIDKSKYIVVAPKNITITHDWPNVIYFENDLDNRLWSEFSAMVYLSTIVKDDEWVQINHYRRIMTNFENHYCVAEPNIFPTTIYNQYASCHNKKDMDILTEVIKDNFPNVYNRWLFILNSNVLYPYNMVNMSGYTYKEYVNFVYNILSKFQEKINVYTLEDMKKYTENYQVPDHFKDKPEYQTRLLSFLSERLTTLYISLLIIQTNVFPMQIQKYDNAL